MAVTRNLYEALYHLRHPGKDRYLWIDAICIDQKNKKERGHQVHLMSSIYANADKVLVWLGTGSKDTDDVLQLMGQMDKAFDQDPIGNSDPLVSSHQRDNFVGLLCHPWFSRVWILQEIRHARTALIICGWSSVSARTFAKVAQRVIHSGPGHFAGELAQRCLPVLDLMPGQLYRGHQKPTLPQLLLKFRTSEATELRDRIYSLMSMASGTLSSEFLYPDYGKDMQDVIGDAICYCLNQQEPKSMKHLKIPWSWPDFMTIVEALVELSGQPSILHLITYLFKARLKQSRACLVQPGNTRDAPVHILWAVSNSRLRVIVANTKPQMQWYASFAADEPTIMLFPFGRRHRGWSFDGETQLKYSMYGTMRLEFKEGDLPIEDTEWVAQCGSLTLIASPQPKTRFEPGDVNRLLDVNLQAEFQNEKLGFIAASMLVNYAFIELLSSTRQLGPYHWSLSFDDLTLNRLHAWLRE